jgi:LAO/AO transport system kinase
LQIKTAMQLLGLFGKHDDLHWQPQTLQISALQSQGVDHFWAAVLEFQRLQMANGLFAQRRQHQSLSWMWERIDAGLKQAFRQNARVQTLLPETTQAVQNGTLAASTAARNLLAALTQPA